MFICGVPLTLHRSSSSQDHQGVAARPGRTPVRVLPLLSMLASARQPVHSWIGSGALAFSSPPRSLSAKDEPARATCPTAHACSSPLLQTPLPYLGTSPTRRRREIATIISAASASGAARRKVGLSCLRGGSAGADGDAPQAIPTATNPSLETEADGERQVQYGGEGGPMVFGGVALVTERSTATGGSEGRVSYSVLADGTLEVGRAEHKRKDSVSAAESCKTSDCLESNPTLLLQHMSVVVRWVAGLEGGVMEVGVVVDRCSATEINSMEIEGLWSVFEARARFC